MVVFLIILQVIFQATTKLSKLKGIYVNFCILLIFISPTSLFIVYGDFFCLQNGLFPESNIIYIASFFLLLFGSTWHDMIKLASIYLNSIRHLLIQTPIGLGYSYEIQPSKNKNNQPKLLDEVVQHIQCR